MDLRSRAVIARDPGQRSAAPVGGALQETAAVSGLEPLRVFPSPTGASWNGGMNVRGPTGCPKPDERAGTAMVAAVGDDGPEVAAAGGFPARIRHRRAGPVDEEPVAARRSACMWSITTGRRWQQARPTRPASVPRSRPRPCRSEIPARRQNGR